MLHTSYIGHCCWLRLWETHYSNSDEKIFISGNQNTPHLTSMMSTLNTQIPNLRHITRSKHADIGD
jgi:secreted Zn-dependent insulinase-like peptidase